jgi:sugar lactone lactonase YvrE
LSSGYVTTIAGDTADIKKGLDSNSGYANASRPFAAKFSNPWGVCVDDTGNVYVADTYNNVIRKIWVSGKVTTYAGRDSAGTTFTGYINGPVSVAEFYYPLSLAIDKSGNIYVTDEGNNAIREISTSGMVTTIAGHGPDSAAYMNGSIDTALFYGPYGVALEKGAIFTSQYSAGYNAIRRIYQNTVSTYSGYDTIGSGNVLPLIPSGYMNGYQGVYTDGTEINYLGDTITYIVKGVLYNAPTGITFDTSGNLLVCDEFNNVIRFMNAKDSLVSTFAGNKSTGIPGYLDGADSVAEFYNPMGIVADKKGNFFVADLGNNLIRAISTKPNFTGVPSVKKPVNTLSVYPNPCTDRLNIVSSLNGNATLLDITGRVVWNTINFKSPYVLSTSGISPGIYFLRITSQSATEIKKVEVVR